jgi:exo-1,4-beta-D-glucosaminidase
VDAGADASVRAFAIPESAWQSSTQIFFVDLALKDAQGETVSSNFYWVPAKLTEFDWAKTDYTHTPALSHEDLKRLRQLPLAKLDAHLEVPIASALSTVRVRLHNPSNALAFQVAVAGLGANGENITSLLWSDNYIELMPGETRVLSASQPKQVSVKRLQSVAVSGWNIQSQTLHVGGQKALIPH